MLLRPTANNPRGSARSVACCLDYPVLEGSAWSFQV